MFCAVPVYLARRGRPTNFHDRRGPNLRMWDYKDHSDNSIAIVSDPRHSRVETLLHCQDLSPACGNSRFLDQADSKTTLVTE